MQDLNITLIQTHQAWEDKQVNLRNYEELLSRVSPTDLILLPEMFNTGFSMNTELAEDSGKSEALDWLRNQAADHGAAIYTSVMIREGSHCYNRGVFTCPDGTQQTYDKRKTFGMAGEDKHIEAGTRRVIVSYKHWKLLLQVCYDLRFPEICRNRLVNGIPEYDGILYVANWPERRIGHWKALLPARAIENQAFVLAVNRVGKDGNDIEYNGQSVAYSGGGELLSGQKEEEIILSANLSHADLHRLRTNMPFLKDI